MNRIKEYRTKRGLTQAELGEMVGVTDASIGNYESGNQNPRKAGHTGAKSCDRWNAVVRKRDVFP